MNTLATGIASILIFYGILLPNEGDVHPVVVVVVGLIFGLATVVALEAAAREDVRKKDA